NVRTRLPSYARQPACKAAAAPKKAKHAGLAPACLFVGPPQQRGERDHTNTGPALTAVNRVQRATARPRVA
ncbi:MAG: hypothetical protein RR240_04360, partial [Burkholderiaceae bacterium]